MKRLQRVGEATPVQVYLRADERARLERLAAQLDTSRAEVLRRGLQALERAVLDPNEHPVLRLSGIGREERGPKVDYDVAVHHDRYLADVVPTRWGYARLPPPSRKPPRRRAKRR